MDTSRHASVPACRVPALPNVVARSCGQPHTWWPSIDSTGSSRLAPVPHEPVMMLWLVVLWLPAAPAHVTGRRELQSCGSATFVAVLSSECVYSNLQNCYDSVACG